MPEKIVPLRLQPAPGVNRDATRLDSEQCIEAEWTRWDGGRARKIGGYQRVTKELGAVSRGMHGFSLGGVNYIHTGGSDRLEQVRVNSSGAASPPAARTPSGFTSNSNYAWQFANVQDTVSGVMRFFAHAAPNLIDLDNSTTGDIYTGTLTATAALTAVSSSACSGGIVALHPYLGYFGDGGFFGWSVANDPDDLTSSGSGNARITSQKLVAGRPIRGAVGYSPAGLLWSLDTLMRVAFIGGGPVWQFDSLGGTTLMSNASIVEYDGVYFWPGLHSFWMFNGQLRELPNPTNLEWFHDNLNWAYRGKMFAWVNRRWGEIWWHFPKGDSTECDHAIVFSVRGNFWYDTPSPLRSAACVLPTYRYPLLAGTAAESNKYRLWQHEKGVDEVDGANTLAIKSYFITNDMTFLKGDQPASRDVEVVGIEPDIEQSGELRWQLLGNDNARADTQESDLITLPEDASRATQIIRPGMTRRQIRHRVESNTIGGDFKFGVPIVHVKPGGDSQTQ